MKTIIWDDRETLVVPVRFLGAGVLNANDGSGPTYYPEFVVRESARHWGLTPVLIDHPTTGKLTAEQQLIPPGRVFNTKFRDGALEAELYLDTERMQQQAPAMLRRLERGEPVEASHGCRSNIRCVSGVHNSRVFNYKALFVWPNHLALLTSYKGVCPVSEGFGANFNRKEKPVFRMNRTKPRIVHRRRPSVFHTLTRKRYESVDTLALPALNFNQDEEKPTTNASSGLSPQQREDLCLPPKLF